MSKMPLKNNSGVIIVETSIIMPLIILVVFIVLYLFLYVLNKECTRADMYVALYQQPETESIKNAVELEKTKEGIGGSLILCTGETAALYLNGNLSLVCLMDMKGKTEISTKMEYGLCSDRLRRWQLYGNLTEK